MKKYLVVFLLLFTSLSALEVDIVSSFNIDELPAQLLRIKAEFTLNKTVPAHYQSKSASDPALKRILVFDPTFGGAPTIMPTLPMEKLVLFVWEPNPFPIEIYDAYARVYTWDDTLVDNEKFFRFNYPYLLPYHENSFSFEEKKLCALVVGNWTEIRLKVMDYFDTYHPEDLHCYGRIPPRLDNGSMYRGVIAGLNSGWEKISTLQRYRFCLCFENTVGTRGYITEKIFSCLAAGCIPIYWGPDNIEDYIPKNCFIDYRDFSSHEELYQLLSTMTEEEHATYVENIKAFLVSDKAYPFSAHYFDELIYQAITQ